MSEGFTDFMADCIIGWDGPYGGPDWTQTEGGEIREEIFNDMKRIGADGAYRRASNTQHVDRNPDNRDGTYSRDA